MSFDNTIKLVKKQRDVLVDVIQWLDEKNFSNSEIRSKVDVILNHSRKLQAWQPVPEMIGCICLSANSNKG